MTSETLSSTDAYCPECRITKLKYCLGDLFVCHDCNKSWFTHQVIDKDGFYLLEECPEHGLNHGRYTMEWEPTLTKKCIQCEKVLVRVPLLRHIADGIGIARQIQKVGDKVCKYRFRCGQYNTDECDRCPNVWESKYKPMSKTKINKMVEASRKRIIKMTGATR